MGKSFSPLKKTKRKIESSAAVIIFGNVRTADTLYRKCSKYTNGMDSSYRTIDSIDSHLITKSISIYYLFISAHTL